MIEAPLCFLDTETTGIHPSRQPWEVAMIRRDPGHPDREIAFFVEVDLSDADPFGLSVGKFYDRHPLGRSISHGMLASSADLQSRHDAAHTIAKWTHGAHIVGAVPNFDTETLAPLLRFFGLIPAWHYHLVDVENLAVGFLARTKHPIFPPWKSDKLSEALGITIPEEERHTAMGDARWARRIYDHIMEPKA